MELLVVIAIIAVLVTVSTTAVMRFRRSADKVAVISNMRQLHIANVSYASDHSSRFVSPGGGAVVNWWENPKFVSQLKSAEATYTGAATTNTELPLSLMDPVVVKKRAAGFDSLAGSYAYNTEGMPTVDGVKKGYTLPLVGDPGRTAAFITADSSAGGVVDHDSAAAKIADRHEKKAIVVYYDGRAAPISKREISDIPGGAANAFWDADQDRP